jgi:hypothetical protein
MKLHQIENKMPIIIKDHAEDNHTHIGSPYQHIPYDSYTVFNFEFGSTYVVPQRETRQCEGY